MCIILKFLIVSLLLANIVLGSRPLPTGAALPSQQGLARLFFNARITAQDPQRSMACFGDYITQSNKNSEEYSRNYNQCLQTSSNERKQVDTEVLEERRIIVNTSQGVCGRVVQCNKLNSSLDLFSCHAESGSENTKATYTISANASDFATLLQERYRTIDLTEEKCCSAAERTYVQNTTRNYDRLQACLDGRVMPETTTTTSTTTTTTTTTTTEAPTTEIPGGNKDPVEIEELLKLLK